MVGDESGSWRLRFLSIFFFLLQELFGVGFAEKRGEYSF